MDATRSGTRWSSLAIASVALSLVWLCGVGSLMGIVLGHAALREIGREPLFERSRPLAWLGLLLGYAGIAAAIFGWILFDAWARALGGD